MNKFLVFLLSCLIAGPTWGQQFIQFFPTLETRTLEFQALVETPANIFIPGRIFGSKKRIGLNSTIVESANMSILYKYNKATSSFVDSVVIAGDTADIDSIYQAYSTASCYNKDRIYFVSSKNLYDSNLGTLIGSKMFLSVVDTNLNVIISDRMIFDYQTSFCFKTIKRLTYFQNKLVGSYYCTDSLNKARLFLINTDGSSIKDTVPQNLGPNFFSETEVTGLIKNKSDSELYIGGSSLGNCITCLYKTDTNLSIVMDYGPLNPLPMSGPSGMFVSEAPFNTSYSDIIDNQLFTAGEYSIQDGPCFAQLQQHLFFTFLSKHRKADGFKRSKELLIPNGSCSTNSSNAAFASKILYSKSTNQIYYVNFNYKDNYPPSDTDPNQIQIVCADTNLNLKWRKLISPKQGVRVLPSQSLIPTEGLGLTIVGFYFDVNDPSDSTLSGKFLLRFDSTGLLSTGSSPQFTVRDRFTVYPNPATSTIWVEDIAGVPAKAFLYDLSGRQVGTYSLTGRKSRLELPAGTRGMYLLRILSQWGEGYSQMIQVTE